MFKIDWNEKWLEIEDRVSFVGTDWQQDNKIWMERIDPQTEFLPNRTLIVELIISKSSINNNDYIEDK